MSSKLKMTCVLSTFDHWNYNINCISRKTECSISILTKPLKILKSLMLCAPYNTTRNVNELSLVDYVKFWAVQFFTRKTKETEKFILFQGQRRRLHSCLPASIVRTKRKCASIYHSSKRLVSSHICCFSNLILTKKKHTLCAKLILASRKCELWSFNCLKQSCVANNTLI